MKITDIWINPLKFGQRQTCLGCKKLVLRKKGKRGPKPKYCTYKCYRRTHRRKAYLKTQEHAKEYSRIYRQTHPEYIKLLNAEYRQQRKQKVEWKSGYLQTLEFVLNR